MVLQQQTAASFWGKAEPGRKVTIKTTWSKEKYSVTADSETLGGMVDGDSKVGDGEPWTPEIKVKGGNSAFYSIGVGKGE